MSDELKKAMKDAFKGVQRRDYVEDPFVADAPRDDNNEGAPRDDSNVIPTFPDVIPSAAKESLKPGETLTVGGRTLTIEKVLGHGAEGDIYVVHDGKRRYAVEELSRGQTERRDSVSRQTAQEDFPQAAESGEQAGMEAEA